MTISEAQLLAWLDGELDDEAVDAVEQAVRADPQLMARAEAHFLTMTRLKNAFAILLNAPLPDMLALSETAETGHPPADGLVTAPPASDGQTARVEPADARSWPMRIGELAPSGWSRWALLFAAVLLGIVVGRFVLGPSSAARAPAKSSDGGSLPSGLISDRNGKLIAGGALAEALRDGLKGDGNASIRIALSFRDKAGRLCRSFDAAQLAGIACHDQGVWRLRLALETSGTSTSGSSESPFIGQAVDAMIAGDPLDAGEERAARDHDWR